MLLALNFFIFSFQIAIVIANQRSGRKFTGLIYFGFYTLLKNDFVCGVRFVCVNLGFQEFIDIHIYESIISIGKSISKKIYKIRFESIN